jgi:hypothetical protein
MGRCKKLHEESTQPYKSDASRLSTTSMWLRHVYRQAHYISVLCRQLSSRNTQLNNNRSQFHYTSIIVGKLVFEVAKLVPTIYNFIYQNLEAPVANFTTTMCYFTTNHGSRLSINGCQLRRRDMKVHDDRMQLHRNGFSQLRRGETTLDNGHNLIIVGMQLKNSGYAI